MNMTDRMMNSTMPYWHDYAKIALNPKLKKGMNQDSKGNPPPQTSNRLLRKVELDDCVGKETLATNSAVAQN